MYRSRDGSNTLYVFLVTLIAAVLTSVSAGSDAITFYYGGSDIGTLRDWRIDRHNVYRWDEEFGNESVIYQTAGTVRYVHKHKQGLLAFLEILGDPQYRQHSVVITDLSGKSLARHSAKFQIWGLTWSPDGRHIAYIGGTSMESDHPGRFFSEGTVILDVVTGEARQVWDKGHAIHWAEFSGDLYMLEHTETGAEVYAYSVETETLTKSDYRDINFPPDGKYYYVPLDDYLYYDEKYSGFFVRFELYLRETNARIQPGPETSLPPQVFTHLRPVMWLDDGMLGCNAFGESDWGKVGATYVLNVVSGELRIAAVRILGSPKAGAVVGLKRDGSMALQEYEDMAVVPVEKLPAPENPEH